jgi:hypothetical protein
MATSGGPNITTEGLVFGYDTGYPLVSGSSDTYKFNKGEPTENLFTITEQDPRNWTPTADKTLLSETYLGLPVYRLQDADGVDPDVYVDNYQSVTAETGLTQGDVYVFSFYFRVIQKNNIADTIANNCAWVWYAGSTDSIFWNDFTLNTWYRAELQATVGSTYSQLLPRIDYDNSIVDICGLQFEKKSHATPFTTGTRSVSGSLVDLTRTHDIDLSDVSFDSNAQITFDGTDDHAVIPYSPTDLDGDAIFSVEAIIKRTDTMSNGGLWGIGGDGGLSGINGYVHGGGTNKITIDLWGTATFHTGVDYPLNEYVHIVWVKTTTGFSTSTIIIYVNGVAYTGSDLTVIRGSSHTPNLNTSTSGKGIVIGRVGPETNLYHAPGEMPIFKVYNKVLTAEEAKQNYNALKSRFELS